MDIDIVARQMPEEVEHARCTVHVRLAEAVIYCGDERRRADWRKVVDSLETAQDVLESVDVPEYRHPDDSMISPQSAKILLGEQHALLGMAAGEPEEDVRKILVSVSVTIGQIMASHDVRLLRAERALARRLHPFTDAQLLLLRHLAMIEIAFDDEPSRILELLKGGAFGDHVQVVGSLTAEHGLTADEVCEAVRDIRLGLTPMRA